MYNTENYLRKASAASQARIVLGAILFFAVFRLLQPIDDVRLALASFALDSLVFCAILLVAGFFWFQRKIRSAFFHSAFLVFFILTFAFYFFFREASVRQYSVFDMSPTSASYFFTDVLPLKGTALLIVALAGIYLLERFLPTVGYREILLLSVLLTLITFASAESKTSLAAHIAADLKEANDSPGVRAAAESLQIPIQDLNAWEHELPLFKPRYKKILVFVMEQIPLSLLLSDAADLPGSTFVNRARRHAHEYSNVIAADMDSRTGLLALLGGRLIPFEAYNDSDVEQYKFLAHKPSILDIMHQAGYATAFSASETEHELVVYDLPWTEKFTLAPEEMPAAKKEYICFNPYEFEHSCEDKILIHRLATFIKKNDRAFLFHEFIFGHASEYLDATNKTSVQYYSEFLDDLTERLERDNLLKDTLIVLTSDHGIRDKGYESWVSTYRIPLWFIHPSFKNGDVKSLYSQIDFRDLLIDEASGRKPNTRARDFAPFMGMTTSSLVGAVTKEQDVLVVKDRKWRSYVMFHTNNAEPGKPGGQPLGDFKAPVLLRYLNDYRAYFLSPQLK